MTEDDTARTSASYPATILHDLFHIGNEFLKLNNEVLMLKFIQLSTENFLVRAALDQDVHEAGVGKCTEELWGGNFIQELLEDHSSTTCDDGHAARPNSDRRHPLMQGNPESLGKMIDSVPVRGSLIPEFGDEAEGNRDDLNRTQADDVIEAGDDEVCKFREGGVVLSEWNNLVGHATEKDGTDDDLADEGQRDPELRVLRQVSVSDEAEGHRSL